MNSGRLIAGLGLWLCTALTAVAQTSVDDSAAETMDEYPRQTIQGSASCLRLDRTADFRVIDSRTVIVWGPNRKKPHKISLFQGCPRLRSADAIYFDADGWDQICGRGGEYLVVTRPGMPRIRRPQDRFTTPRRQSFPSAEQVLIEERCAVASVELINDDVVHELLVQGGHAAPRGPERPDQFEVMTADSEVGNKENKDKQ